LHDATLLHRTCTPCHIVESLLLCAFPAVATAAYRHLLTAVFCARGFDASTHITVDAAHTLGGTVVDVYVKCSQNIRFNQTVMDYEVALQRFTTEQLQQQPWRMSPTDQAAAETCLYDIAAASDSRMTGSRFTRLFSASKKKKLHSSFVLAGPFGKQRLQIWVVKQLQSAVCNTVYTLHCGAVQLRSV
jgi:hypothetical protein